MNRRYFLTGILALVFCIVTPAWGHARRGRRRKLKRPRASAPGARTEPKVVPPREPALDPALMDPEVPAQMTEIFSTPSALFARLEQLCPNRMLFAHPMAEQVSGGLIWTGVKVRVVHPSHVSVLYLQLENPEPFDVLLPWWATHMAWWPRTS